ncbi:hypothetical protein Daura_44370 [Dactylosporangium aurantiacum]|uniref:Uncharacterized protein n=1 Tax=Dactylosporangium aurantiacum TaxID=35754 RepID=A0A9Q9MIB3_9ACTN|nr:hypothetical protein [Dactylosporangium aurantiacum]MDG6102181.1 hypothetical protein [Dactylosporangium aurantiacum]UWZ53501.1 hypothetical protein Daura_44370 [Dactylosporangium aurantiacum]
MTTPIRRTALAALSRTAGRPAAWSAGSPTFSPRGPRRFTADGVACRVGEPATYHVDDVADLPAG